MGRSQQPQRPSENPLIIQYANLLHQYGDPNCTEVREFVSQHADDEVFVRRTKVLDRAFSHKPELTKPDIDRAIGKEEGKDMEGRS